MLVKIIKEKIQVVLLVNTLEYFGMDKNATVVIQKNVFANHIKDVIVAQTIILKIFMENAKNVKQFTLVVKMDINKPCHAVLIQNAIFLFQQ